jgi:hypothetical protein
VKSLRRSSRLVRLSVPQTLIAACVALGVRVSAIARDELRRRGLGRRALRFIFALLSLAIAKDGGAQAPVITKSVAFTLVGDAAITLDWRMTVLSLERGAVETNVVLGPHPSSGALLGYNVVALAGYTATVMLLPKPWRYLVAIGVVGLESVCIAKNLRWQSAHRY